MKPLVSVMMPVLDPHPVYFRAAVESVLAQTLTDLELVIVEDPGRSSGAEILSGIADPRIRHICNPKRTSLVDQRNRALAEARADFVAMLDADDIAKPERLQKQYDYLQAYPNVDVLGTQLFIIDESGKQLGFRSYPLKHAQIVAAMHSYNAIAQPSVMARARALRDVGGYQYRTFPVNEDYELWSRLASRGAQLANHPEPLLEYRIHPYGTKAQMLHRMLRATIDVKNRYWRDQMDARAKIRYWGEHVLLGLPAPWVLRLFIMTQYGFRERRN
jgi:glycosyltransferase involved in cell wall biosynthesis